jgi:hypothetical protein
MNTLKIFLEKVELINKKYDEIEKINGTNFNIFSIMRMERDEVKTHSNFIFELLNKDGLHGQGYVYIKLFLTNVLGLDSEEVLNVEQEDRTLENRRIDFTIETNNYQIGIEMKIDAKDQEHQMFDYYYELKERRKTGQSIKLFYLTLDGKEPTPDSLNKGKEKLSDEEYELISFENEIINWLELCIKESATNSTVREAIMQYLNLVNRITNKLNTKEEVREITQMLSNEKTLKAYLNAKESEREAKINLQLGFWKNLEEKLYLNSTKENDLKFQFQFPRDDNINDIKNAVENYYNKSQNNRDYGLNLYLDNEQNIYIFIALNHYLYYDVGSEKDNSIQLIDEIKKLYRWDGNEEFNCWKLSSEKLNFLDLLDTPKVLELFDIHKLNQITDGIVKEVKIIKKDVLKIIEKSSK